MPQLEAADLIRKTIEDNVAIMGDKIKDVQTSEGEERAKLVEELDAVKAQVDGLQSALDEANSRPNFSGVETTGKGEKGKFSMGRFMKLVTGMAQPGQTGFDKEFGYELEVIKMGQELHNTSAVPDQMKTAINASTDAAGGFLIPTELMADIIPELEAQEIAAQAGATIINGMVGNVSWAVDNGGIAAVYVDSEAEETGSESTLTVSSINITPHVAAAFVPLTWAMLAQPAIAMDAYVTKRIGRKLALREDLSYFLGTGSNSEPIGMFNKSSITALSAVTPTTAAWGQGATPTPTVDEDLFELVQTVLAANGLTPGGRFAFVMGSTILANLAVSKNTRHDLVFREKNQALPTSLMGYPVFASTQLDAASGTAHQLGFGDFSESIIARWGTMSFDASNTTETNFRKLRTTVRGVSAHDMAFLQDGSFATGTLNTANAKY